MKSENKNTLAETHRVFLTTQDQRTVVGNYLLAHLAEHSNIAFQLLQALKKYCKREAKR
jgi:hypothetical protein